MEVVSSVVEGCLIPTVATFGLLGNIAAIRVLQVNLNYSLFLNVESVKSQVFTLRELTNSCRLDQFFW